MPTFAQRCQSAMSRSSCTFGDQRGLRRLEPADDLFVVALGRQLRNRAERDAEIFQRALGGLQREIGPRGQRLESRGELLKPRQRLAPLALLLFVGRGVARRECRVGLRISRRDLGIGRVGMAHGAPLAPNQCELPPRRRQIVERRGLHRVVRQLGLPRPAPFGLLPRRIFLGLAPRALGSVMLGAATALRLPRVRATRSASSARLASSAAWRVARLAGRLLAGRRVALGGAGRFGRGHRRGRGVLLGGCGARNRLVHLAKDHLSRAWRPTCSWPAPRSARAPAVR